MHSFPPQHLQWCSNINDTTCDINIPYPLCSYSGASVVSFDLHFWGYLVCVDYDTWTAKSLSVSTNWQKAKQNELGLGVGLPTVQFHRLQYACQKLDSRTMFSVWFIISSEPSWAVPLQCQCIVSSRELHPAWWHWWRESHDSHMTSLSKGHTWWHWWRESHDSHMTSVSKGHTWYHWWNHMIVTWLHWAKVIHDDTGGENHMIVTWLHWTKVIHDTTGGKNHMIVTWLHWAKVVLTVQFPMRHQYKYISVLCAINTLVPRHPPSLSSILQAHKSP